MFISEATLAHCRTAEPGFEWGAYREGRMVWGITCVVSGRAELQYKNGSRDLLGPGTVALIPDSARYRFFVPADGEECLHYTVNFKLLEDRPPLSEPDRAVVLRPGNFPKFQRNFEKCVSAWEQKQEGYRMLVMSRLYEILFDFLSLRQQLQTDPAAYRQTLPAHTYMIQNYAQPITLEQLATLCGLSVTHFRRVFIRVYGVSPIQYLLRYRLEKAKDLLQLHDLTLEQIAESCGFQSVSYFVRYFRQHTHMTPHQYRQRY